MHDVVISPPSCLIRHPITKAEDPELNSFALSGNKMTVIRDEWLRAGFPWDRIMAWNTNRDLCPRFARARAAHLIPIAPDLSLSTLFGSKEGGKALLEFLEVTKACFKPLEEPPIQDDCSHPILSRPHLLTRTNDQNCPLSYHVQPAFFA